MADPRFSVVIPAFNSMATLDETVGSVLAQTQADLELIVVDDGSTDGTPQRLAELRRSDPRLRVMEQANAGTAAARNAGAAEARGEHLSFLDHDDLWLPGYLEAMERALRDHPTAGFAFTDAWILDDRYGRILRRTSFEHYDEIPVEPSPEDLLLRLIEINFVMSSVTLHREAFAAVDGFDPAIRGADDWDLWLRLAAAGYSAAPAGECALIQRNTVGSQSKDEAMMLRNMERVLTRVGTDYEAPPAAVAAAAREIERIRRRRRRQPMGPTALAARARMGLQHARDRWVPGRRWLPAPPEEVAQAFPSLAAGYGRPPSRAS
jgi:glycosyltransferase involved in cell wall biosynthesis